MSIKRIGTFTFASIQWKIVIDPRRCDKAHKSYIVSFGETTIYLNNEYKEVPFGDSAMEFLIYRAIIDCMLDSLSLSKYNNVKLTIPLASMIVSFRKTYTGSEGNWNGSLSLMGVRWNVVVNNELCNNCGAFGFCDPNSLLISISTVDDKEIIPNDKIYVTLIHEILHGAMFMMGRYDHKYLNEENFICTFSLLLSQVIKSIKYKL